MAEQGSGSSKKFPYIIIPNASSPVENMDGVYSSRSRDTQAKREVSARAHPKNDRQGGSYNSSAFLSYMKDPYQHANMLSHPAAGHVPFGEFNSQLNAISMSQMQAILTAQKELRKPAGALYPTASQISLIPETEMIYKKYFPNDGNETKIEIVASRNKGSEKDRGGGVSVTTSSTKANNDNHTLKDPNGKQNVTASSSVSESNMTIFERGEKIDPSVRTRESVQRMTEPCKIPTTTIDKQVAAFKQRDAEVRFKKRIQTQLVSLCAEVEKQSSDLNDMKKELKELLHMSRKNSTDVESSKARIDTLSKHVHEIDNKLDTMQENVCGQEKSLLSKLMLLGEISDSDSDLDESAAKGIDALCSPSGTKLALLSGSKRPFSAGSSDGLPKSCCNWVPIAPDFDKLLQAVALLNYRMDRNQSMKLCATNKGATFKHADVIDLAMYKNGIILGSTGFRSYSTMSVIRFVNEIFNGYLPTELSTQYPDGVVIVLTDKRSVVYSCDGNFNGVGTKLSVKDPPDILPGKGLNKLQKNESVESVKASTTTSLSTLPTTSRVSSVTNISRTYEVLPELELVGHCDAYEVKAKPKTIVLKIIVQKNDQRYKIRVPVTATIQAVTEHLGGILAQRNSNVTRNTVNSLKTPRSYDMILPVPLGRLSCTSSTLEDYGLIQNTLVYLQEQQS